MAAGAGGDNAASLAGLGTLLGLAAGSDRRVYVGSIPYEFGEDTIRQTFGSIGPIAHVEMPKEGPNKHKGYCFVDYLNPEHAMVALATMDGYNLGGRPLKVNKASGGMNKAAGLNPLLAAAANPILGSMNPLLRGMAPGAAGMGGMGMGGMGGMGM